jgi:hypothetical protein
LDRDEHTADSQLTAFRKLIDNAQVAAALER